MGKDKKEKKAPHIILDLRGKNKEEFAEALKKAVEVILKTTKKKEDEDK